MNPIILKPQQGIVDWGRMHHYSFIPNNIIDRPLNHTEEFCLDSAMLLIDMSCEDCTKLLSNFSWHELVANAYITENGSDLLHLKGGDAVTGDKNHCFAREKTLFIPLPFNFTQKNIIPSSLCGFQVELPVLFNFKDKTLVSIDKISLIVHYKIVEMKNKI